jgi:hypothetical protein
MMATTQQSDGDEWQAFIVQLLYLRYGADLVVVPDQHKGDSGIEAFAMDGCAFQCYFPESPSSVANVAAKHKEKISRDIKKFCENRSDLHKIFGTTKIRRWILVVPDHCSADVVQFCQKKANEVRSLAAPLPYVSDDFQVITVDGYKFFAAEIAEMARTGGLLVEATDAPAAPVEVQSFAEQHIDLVETLELKLAKLHLERADHAELVQKLLRTYLEGSNAIHYYDNKYPVISDKIRSAKQARAKALEIDSKLQNLTIAGTREKFEAELAGCVPSLGRQTAIVLSFACVAEWLMVCPLDPKG